MPNEYRFTVDWFSHVVPVWQQLLHRFQPSRFLEIGAYEGRSACFIIQSLAGQRPIELHCVDTWEGGVGHDNDAMFKVEPRFDSNLRLALAGARHKVDFHKHKGASSDILPRLLAEGRREHFDLIYVDGSHQAPDVLADAVLSFQLLKVGGLLIFDDYVWSPEAPGEQDFFHLPKPAVDAFVNIYQRKLEVIMAPLYQLYTRKTAP